MGVKRSQSGSRILAVLEAVALHQPIGVSALSRLLGCDKSAAQRALMTLADDGWVRPAAGETVRWELTQHLLALAYAGHRSDDLRVRARPALEDLLDRTGETILLAALDARQFVVIDFVESRHTFRLVPRLGLSITVRDSATGRAVLPYLSADEQAGMLGEPVDDGLLAAYAAVRERGYSISAGDIVAESVNVAAPIFGPDGRPLGALVVSGPIERLVPDRRDEIGRMVAAAAAGISQTRRERP